MTAEQVLTIIDQAIKTLSLDDAIEFCEAVEEGLNIRLEALEDDLENQYE